ncbi:hypothetical protein [Kluyvera sp. CRP]|uniref:hypothetical protein n=1 Tax=Kluyvera sp. CRP TaxID=2873269 RepID=UPI001CC1E304|nr:hypothetical protein [Kluyvera sp. CRP]UAK18524.1 hypothetical protein K7B04_14390 [Kluyvera sp. CRP]
MKKITPNERKHHVVTARLNNEQVQVLNQLISSGKVQKDSLSACVQYLINQYMILHGGGNE